MWWSRVPLHADVSASEESCETSRLRCLAPHSARGAQDSRRFRRVGTVLHRNKCVGFQVRERERLQVSEAAVRVARCSLEISTGHSGNSQPLARATRDGRRRVQRSGLESRVPRALFRAASRPTSFDRGTPSLGVVPQILFSPWDISISRDSTRSADRHRGDLWSAKHNSASWRSRVRGSNHGPNQGCNLSMIVGPFTSNFRSVLVEAKFPLRRIPRLALPCGRTLAHVTAASRTRALSILRKTAWTVHRGREATEAKPRNRQVETRAARRTDTVKTTQSEGRKLQLRSELSRARRRNAPFPLDGGIRLPSPFATRQSSAVVPAPPCGVPGLLCRSKSCGQRRKARERPRDSVREMPRQRCRATVRWRTRRICRSVDWRIRGRRKNRPCHSLRNRIDSRMPKNRNL